MPNRQNYLCFFFILSLLAGACAKKERPVTAPTLPVRPPQALQADEFAANAAKLAKEAQYNSANFYLGKAIETYTKVKEWEKTIECYIHLGDNYQQLENYEKARQELNNALETTKNNLGYKHLELAKSFQKLGYKYLRGGQYDLAIEMYDKALIIQLELLGKEHPEVAKTYNSIALAYWNKGDSQKAHTNYNKSFFIKLRQFHDVDFDVVKEYRLLDKKDIQTKDFSSARNYFNRSLTTYRETYGTNDALFAAIYENIGILYAFEGDFNRALEYQRKAFSLRVNIYGEESPEVASSYRNIGVCLRLKGDDNEALWFLNKALAFEEETDGKEKPDTADIHYQLGKIYFKMDEFDKALASYQKAIGIIAPGYSAHNIYKHPNMERVLLNDRLLKILGAKAEVLKTRYLYNPSRLKDLRFSLSTYLLMADMAAEMRRGYKSESYKLLFGEKSHEIYDNGIQTALMLYEMDEETQEKYKYIDAAFTLSERSKAAVLMETLAESRARRFAGLPDDLLEKEKKLKDELNLYDTFLEKEYQAGENADRQRVKNLETHYFDLKDQYQRLIEYFESQYPKYYDLKYNRRPVTVPDLQKALDPSEAFIEYFVGQETMNIFVLTRDDLEAVSLPIDKDFNRVIEACYLAIKKIEEQEFPVLSRQLYRLLMEPIRRLIAEKKKLIIIPHGQLYYVPFESLAGDAVEAKNFSDPDYMIKHFAISYHYSAWLWLQNFAAKRFNTISKNAGFVGFAPVFGNPGEEDKKQGEELQVKKSRDVVIDGKRYPQLPSTEQEVRSIIRLFTGKGIQASGYYRGEASEDRFKSVDMKDYSIIHVATHSLNDLENPKLSGLIFSQSPRPGPLSAQEDGILYSGETYNLNLNAELIVLSSCESGIGKLVKGEGMIALNRGFLYSGVRNTIFSLWKVEDKTTSRLMVELYRNILEGKTLAAALRRAKLELLRDPFTAFPKYWSGFILVGE